MLSLAEVWLTNFVIQYFELSLRVAKSASVARSMELNKVNVGKFFHPFHDLVDKHKFRPYKIFNIDVTGITIVQKKRFQIIGFKGRRQVGIIN